MRRMTSWTKPFLPEPESYSLIPPSPRSPAARAGGFALDERELQGSCHALASGSGAARRRVSNRACAPATPALDTSLRSPARLQPSCVSALWSQTAPGGATRACLQRACEGSSSAFPAPRRPDTQELRSEVPSTSAGGRRTRRTSRNIAAFSVRESIRRTPSVKQRGAAARARKPWNPRRSRASLPRAARSPSPSTLARRAPAASEPTPLRHARGAGLRIPCHREMRSCVGVAAILTVASANHRRHRRIRAPRRTLRHPGFRGIVAPCFGQSGRRAGARDSRGACASGARARSRARRAARGSGTARRRGRGSCACR